MRVLGPYTAADLGLRYGYDLQWLVRGRDLIVQVAKANGIVRADDRAAARVTQ
jgi:hypothetical protein